MPGRAWTADELAALAACPGRNRALSELATRLGRTFASVQARNRRPIDLTPAKPAKSSSKPSRALAAQGRAAWNRRRLAAAERPAGPGMRPEDERRRRVRWALEDRALAAELGVNVGELTD